MQASYAWMEPIQDGISRVEEVLLDVTGCDDPELTSTARYAVRSGGKRVRPAIVLLAHRALGGDPDEVVELAAALEMIHVATLIHDDILDGSPIRRRRSSLNRKFGQNRAIVTGDFFFVQGFDLGGRYGPKVVQVTAEACRAIAEAEFAQSRILGNPEVTKEDYLGVIAGKTASLMAAGAKVGGLTADGDAGTLDALWGYGHHLGMAFQITDDILDVAGDPSRMGKPRRMDLQQGNPTIPTIEALNGTSGQKKHKLVRVLSGDGADDDQVDEAARIIATSGSLEKARDLARDHAEEAVARLDGVDGDVAPLADLAEFVVERER